MLLNANSFIAIVSPKYRRASFYFLLMAGLGLATAIGMRTSGKSAASLALHANAQAQKATSFTPPEVELVTLRATGFDPDTLTRPKGPFMLVIENRSGVSDLSYQFDKEVGAKLKTIKHPVKSPSWADIVDLNPGTYKLTEDNHPQWSLTLTVSPHNK